MENNKDNAGQTKSACPSVRQTDDMLITYVILFILLFELSILNKYIHMNY